MIVAFTASIWRYVGIITSEKREKREKRQIGLKINYIKKMKRVWHM